MRKLLCSFLTILCISLVGCGGKKVDNDTEILINEADSVKDISEKEEIADSLSEESVEQEESVSEIQENSEKEKQDLEKEFSFVELKNLNFSFLSGAGGWSTELVINEDGTFSGVYHDSEVGSASEEYPNGTYYYCSFHGKFTQPVQKDEYIYSITIENITYDNPVGTEENLWHGYPTAADSH